jgi:hypothetical protein
LRQEVDKEKGELELSLDGSEEDIPVKVPATKHTKKGGKMAESGAIEMASQSSPASIRGLSYRLRVEIC